MFSKVYKNIHFLLITVIVLTVIVSQIFRYNTIQENLANADDPNALKNCSNFNDSKGACTDLSGAEQGQLCDYDDKECESCFRKQCKDIISKKACNFTNNLSIANKEVVNVPLDHDCYGQDDIADYDKVFCPTCRNGLVQTENGECIAPVKDYNKSCEIFPSDQTQPYVPVPISKGNTKTKCVPNSNVTINYNCIPGYERVREGLLMPTKYGSKYPAYNGRCVPSNLYSLIEKQPNKTNTSCGSGLVYNLNGSCVPSTNKSSASIPYTCQIDNPDIVKIGTNPYIFNKTTKLCEANTVIDTVCPSKYRSQGANLPCKLDKDKVVVVNIPNNNTCYGQNNIKDNKILCPACRNGLNQTLNGECVPNDSKSDKTCKLNIKGDNQPFLPPSEATGRCKPNPEVKANYVCTTNHYKLNEPLDTKYYSEKMKQYEHIVNRGRCVPSNIYTLMQKNINTKADVNCGDTENSGLNYTSAGNCVPVTTEATTDKPYICNVDAKLLIQGDQPYKYNPSSQMCEATKIIDTVCPKGYSADSASSNCTPNSSPPSEREETNPCSWNSIKEQCKPCSTILEDQRSGNKYCFVDQNNQPMCTHPKYKPSYTQCTQQLKSNCIWSGNKCVPK